LGISPISPGIISLVESGLYCHCHCRSLSSWRSVGDFCASAIYLIILYIYLILNASIVKKQRGKCLSCTSYILHVSELLACSRPVYNGNMRKNR
jgi:hypothetical protein